METGKVKTKIWESIIPVYARGSRLLRRFANRLRSWCDHWLMDLYARSEGWQGSFLLWLITRVRLLLVLFLDGLRGKAQVWEGSEIDTGLPLRVVYLADRRSYKLVSPEYLKSILFQPGSVQVTKHGSFLMPRIRSMANTMAGQADLVIVEANKLIRFHPKRQEHSQWWIVEPRMHMVMDFREGQRWEEIEESMHAQRKNLKIMERCQCTFEISQSEEDFDLFYQRMHVPLITERFNTAAQVESKEEMRKVFRKGNLMLIKQDQQPIAGALNFIHGRNVFGIGMGVLDGDKRWYSIGAMPLLYYHTIRWCYENGVRRLNFGGTRPFLTDGLYDYKKRWGFQPCYDPWMERTWLFWKPAKSSAAKGWLERHPFLLPAASSEAVERKEKMADSLEMPRS